MPGIPSTAQPVQSNGRPCPARWLFSKIVQPRLGKFQPLVYEPEIPASDVEQSRPTRPALVPIFLVRIAIMPDQRNVRGIRSGLDEHGWMVWVPRQRVAGPA